MATIRFPFTTDMYLKEAQRIAQSYMGDLKLTWDAVIEIWSVEIEYVDRIWFGSTPKKALRKFVNNHRSNLKWQ